MPTQTLSHSSPNPGGRPQGAAKTPKRRPWLIAVIIILALAALYLVLGFLTGRVLSPGTTVAGVDIGGQSTTSAEATLRGELGDKAGEEIELKAGKPTAALDPKKAGVSFDMPGTIGRATGFTLNPTIIWDRLFGDDEIEPVISIDEKTFEDATGKVTKSLELEPVDAELSYVKSKPEVKDGSNGQSVDTSQVRTAIEESWLRTEDPLPVTATDVEPDITTAEAKDVADGFAKDAVSKELTVHAKPAKDSDSDVDAGDLTVSPSTVAKTLTFEPKDSKLVPVFAEEDLQKRVLAANKDVGKPAKDASFTIKGGKPKVVESETGIGIKKDELTKAVTDAIKGETDKPTVTLASVKPDFTTKDAKKANVSDVMSEFSTGYSSEPNRDTNLKVATKKVSGTVVQPGEQFSLNEAIGQRTAANGYKAAGVISDGRMKEDFGGGVSQVSTTLFNAAFFAGFDLDEHQAHSRYISRYPEGRESTLDWSSIDMKFTNTSKQPIVLDMYLSGGEVHAKVFGDKKLKVDSDSSERYNYSSPGSVTDSGPECTPQSPKQGWSIKITRTMKDIVSGKTTKDSFVTVYRPVNKVECKD
ncbi:Vancomycin resistance protein YoaR, contains peptidoglycan-binding and VanW domains [Brevibacterium sp. 239c]|uniref:VanW family protein n=1 Tax=Brevibacterium sp. 239c TaxID=1965356 RepID=UPI000C6799DB|nr:VanW family protein [Brevibacterium sp. 239c]SMX89163.1 Vancomycin resistance protein YoaR, contains peptidoglycan-binding and VanW domains [Brevibacterium sp. 239c]